MNINKIKSILTTAFENPLPGVEAQLNMAPFSRSLTPDKNAKTPRQSAVLLLLSPFNNQICITLIQRPHYEGVHSNQIALPGGKKELSDLNLLHTAQRETEEEVGIPAHAYHVFGAMTRLYIPPSNFYVTPYVALATEPLNFVADQKEVAEIIQLPIQSLLHENIKKEQKLTMSTGFALKTNTYVFNENTIWGATAMILSEFESLLKLAN